MTDVLEAVQAPATRNALSPAQRALLEKRLRGRPEARLAEIPRRTEAGPAPLSFAQQRLWFHEQLEPGQPTYNVPIAVTLRGPLDVAALEAGLHDIAQRHAILRTTFAVVDGEPAQIVASTLDIPLPIMEAQSLSDAEIEAQLAAEARVPFDLSQGPLWRVRLLRLGVAEHILQLTFHHIIFDGWSLGVFFREFGVLYAARVTRQTPSLPELPIQYADFAVWQREWLKGDVLQRQLAYWQEKLSGRLPALNLPADRPRPPVQTHNGALQRFTLPAVLYAGAQALAQEEGVSLFMLLLAAFEVLLYRYTGQEDFIIGAPIANRTRSEVEGLIGFFVNTLALRGDLAGQPSFRELLDRTRRVALEAYDHQDLPFERLVEALQPERDLSRSPLFQAMFVLQNAVDMMPKLHDLTTTYNEVDNQTALFDLTLTLEETGTGLQGYFEYNTDLFDADTIHRMIGHLQTLLHSAISNPDQPITMLTLLTSAEKQQLLVEWNDTAVAYPEDDYVHRWFTRQAQQTPEATAVIYEEQRFTYREINCRANQLAHYLRKRDIGPETLVGLYMERTPEAVIGLLGVLKAGAAYLPLDPTHPPARTTFMLQDARVAGLLTQTHLDHNLMLPSTHRICLDSDWDAIAQESTDDPVCRVTPDNLAYMIYTSGSTGLPKGALITHRGLSNYLHWCIPAYDVAGGQGAPVHSALSFDLTITSLFPPLLTGGAITLLPEAEGGAALAEALRREHDFSLVKLTPSHLEVLAHLLATDDIQGCARAFVIGGEALWGEQLTFWQTRTPHTRLINEYGPTETVVGCCTYEVPPGASIHGAVPIGRPIANTQLYILDRRQQLLPIGVLGELAIGGDGVARGYHNRPALTAERFIPDPFSTTPGGRLYRTGDLARYLPDGNIEYLGRLDEQVKIRGYRIEPGEIETALLQQPGVEAVAVVTAKDTARQEQLVAYIVPQNGYTLAIDDLREEIKRALPAYMVPASFVVRTALPLTPNGKVDRQALAALGVSQAVMGTAYIAPRTTIEKQLAAIWTEVLHIEQISVDANFFNLGGHSLQAVQLVSKIVAALHAPISVKTLFLHPTIAELASALQTVAPTTEAYISKPASSANAFLAIERRSLLGLFAAGKLAPVESAALGYLDRTSQERDALLHERVAELPLFTDVIETALGRVAIILLPRFDDELYYDPQNFVARIIDALHLAHLLGARAVSLTGLIPSATEYGRAIVANSAYTATLPTVTTGHAATSATVILAVKRILRESERQLERERVGVLGLGSIGLTSLRLMLSTLPHPQTLLLCDLYDKRDVLENARREIVHDFGFAGEVQIVASQRQVPAAFYTASLILGATNTAEVLDIAQVQPGTLIVDDSSPRCFSSQAALQRLHTDGDILFTEGGVLKSPNPIEQTTYLPESWGEPLIGYARRDVHDITGCILAGLLAARFDNLTPTVGPVTVVESVQHYYKLKALGFDAADLHSDQYTLEPHLIERFRQRFGGQ